MPDGSNYALTLNGGANITVKDSVGTGVISSRGLQTLNTGNTLTIESGKIVACGGTEGSKNGGACVWNNAGNTLNIHGGTFTTTAVGTPSDAAGSGCLYNAGTATITGGTFTSVNRRTYAIVSIGNITLTPAQEGSIAVSGAHGGIAVDGGTAVINGGSYTSGEYYGLYVSEDRSTATVTVNDGTFDGKSNAVCVGSDHSAAVNSTVTINNGTFKKPITAQENAKEGALVAYGGHFVDNTAAKYQASGMARLPQGDGTFKLVPAVIRSIDLRIKAPQAGQKPDMNPVPVSDPDGAVEIVDFHNFFPQIPSGKVIWGEFTNNNDDNDKQDLSNYSFMSTDTFVAGKTYVFQLICMPTDAAFLDAQIPAPTVNGKPMNLSAQAFGGLPVVTYYWELPAEVPATGDGSMLGLWLMLLAASAGVAILLCKKKAAK